MHDLQLIIEPLDTEARTRVLQWALDKFKITPPASNSAGAESSSIPAAAEFSNFAELYNKAQPSNNAERALLAGYWLQVFQDCSEFPSQAANKELQNLGHYIPNITDAFTQLKSRKPALAIQIKKGGKTQQARKQYKLTQAGIDTIKAMIQQ
jgi:hypothetical protein